MSALRTPLCDRLGLRLPIFGFSHSIDVTVALAIRATGPPTASRPDCTPLNPRPAVSDDGSCTPRTSGCR